MLSLSRTPILFNAILLSLSIPNFLLAAENSCDTQRNTAEMDACAASILKSKDAELNSAYQALMKALVPDDMRDSAQYAELRKKMQTAQRAWIQYRDADCGAMYDFHIDGSIRNSVSLRCKTDKTVQRTKELKSWIAY